MSAVASAAQSEELLEPEAVSEARPALSEAGRAAEAAIDPAFLQRWSSRAFSSAPLEHEMLRSLFEAARFAPSAGNLQPWAFVYAAERATRRRALPILEAENRRWAAQAPLLVFVFARRHHPKTRAPLRTAAFDTGAAWLSLALQARHLGLNCRAMGGIRHDLAYQLLGVPEAEFESLVAIAVGYPGQRDALPADLAAKDVPSSRERQGTFVYNGRYFDRDA